MEMVWQRQGERRRGWRMAVLIALLLAVICVRPGFAVTVDGEALGVYAPVAVRRSIAAAEAAAREISGETVDLSSALKLQFRLTMMPRSRDLRRLERALLEAAPGVERLWVVRAGERFLGAVDDVSVLGELQRVLISSHAGPYTVSARLEPELHVRRSFVRGASVLSQEELSRRLQQYVSVHTVDMAQELRARAEHGIVVRR